MCHEFAYIMIQNYSFISRYVLYVLKKGKILNDHCKMVTDRKELKIDFTGMANSSL